MRGLQLERLGGRVRGCRRGQAERGAQGVVDAGGGGGAGVGGCGGWVGGWGDEAEGLEGFVSSLYW